jgi:hypothetical protein
MIGCWSLGTSTTVARRSNDGPPRRYIQTTHGWATSFGTCSRARGKAVSASRLLDYGHITMAMLAWRDNGPLGRLSPSYAEWITAIRRGQPEHLKASVQFHDEALPAPPRAKTPATKETEE